MIPLLESVNSYLLGSIKPVLLSLSIRGLPCYRFPEARKGRGTESGDKFTRVTNG